MNTNPLPSRSRWLPLLVLLASSSGCSSGAAESTSGDDAKAPDAAGDVGTVADTAEAEVAIEASTDATSDVNFDADACSDVCKSGATRCSSGGVETCAIQPSGCLGWGPAVACATGRVCSSDACQTVSAISAGMDFTCALLSDKTVRCWGLDNEGQLGDGGGVNSRLPLAVPGVANAGALAAGRYHACVVQEDGSVRC